jgi:hypothetical protein
MKIEYPLLKSYLRSSPSHPAYMPGWITPVSWAVFAALTFFLAVRLELACIGVGIAGALAYAFDHLLRSRYRPRNSIEQADEAGFSALRKLKSKLSEGLHRKLPDRILLALERAVEAHNAALARIAIQDPHLLTDQQDHLRRRLHACFVAAATMMRDDQHSRREWQAMSSNAALIEEIVSAIDLQIAQMRSPSEYDHERLAALQELHSDVLPEQHHLG